MGRLLLRRSIAKPGKSHRASPSEPITLRVRIVGSSQDDALAGVRFHAKSCSSPGTWQLGGKVRPIWSTRDGDHSICRFVGSLFNFCHTGLSRMLQFEHEKVVEPSSRGTNQKNAPLSAPKAKSDGLTYGNACIGNTAHGSGNVTPSRRYQAVLSGTHKLELDSDFQPAV